jgi:hypothetical protein
VEAEVSRSISAALLALTLACCAAQAADWVWLGMSEDGAQEFFVDASSIRIAGDVRHAWFKSAHARHTVRRVGDDSGNWVSAELGQHAFNCGDTTRSAEAIIIYYEDGSNHALPAQMFPSQWVPVPPNTIGASEMKFICVWTPK